MSKYLLIDTREKPKAITGILNYFDRNGIEYDVSKLFFGDYMDDLVYNNCPVHYLRNMPWDHPYIAMYNDRKIVIAVGQGAWEDSLKASTGKLCQVMQEKGIHGQVDFWGHDVSHDWHWWYRMVAHYAPRFLY